MYIYIYFFLINSIHHAKEILLFYDYIIMITSWLIDTYYPPQNVKKLIGTYYNSIININYPLIRV